MKLKPLLSFILFATFFVANAQQNNIPSEQKLYIDFNGNTSDNSLNGHSLASTNISFEADRSSQPLRAGRFGGCSALSHIQISDFEDKMNFTTGGTIALWAKPDLNNSMDPATGNCIANGRHVFFSKGGDGFNTPPGFFAYTTINNGVQTIAFESSSNSGNTRDSFTMPYTDTWHHYAFVFTTTNLKVYVDGVLKRDVTISLSFAEANNQTLYIGTLGPKSTPVNGITYWFPFGGLMDEFRLFTKALTAAEVADVFNESYDMIAPSVQRLDFLGSAATYTSLFAEGLFQYQNSTIAVLNRNTVVTRMRSNGSSVEVKSIDDNGDLLWSNRLHDYYYSGYDQPAEPDDDCIGMASTTSFLLKNGTQLGIEISGNRACGKFYIIDNQNGNVVFEKDLVNEHAITIFEKNNTYYVLLNEYNASNYRLAKYDASGNEIGTISLSNSAIKDYDWDEMNGLLLTGVSKTYIINIPSLSYSQLSTSGRICKWVGNNFIVSDDNHTYRISPSFSYTQLANSFRNIDLLNNGGYIVHAANSIQSYSSIHLLQSTVSSINTGVTVLPFSNNLLTRSTQDIYTLYDLSGNLLWQVNRNSPYYSLSFSEQDDLSFFVTRPTQLYTDVFKYTSTGNLLWENRFKTAGDIRFLNDLSVGGKRKFLLPSLYFSSPFGTPSYYLFLGEFTNESNPCDFSIESDTKENYCANDESYQYDKNLINPLIGGRPLYSTSNANISSLSEKSNLQWSLDGNLIPTNNIFYGSFGPMSTNITQSGTYKLTVRQGVCEKSIEKVVNVSNAFNPPAPTLTASFNPICVGDITTITASNCAGSITWNDLSYNEYNADVATVSPSSSTAYTANCYIRNSAYGNCRSANSSPFTVNVITLPEVISLGGNSPLSATYRAERINSQQNVIINGAIDYKSKNAIVLNPGFSTESNAVFNAKIVSSCIE